MRTVQFLLIQIALIIPFCVQSQSKVMDPSVYDIWNTIENIKISNNGDWVSYELTPGKGDGTLIVYNTRTAEEIKISRAENARFDAGNNFLAFMIVPHADSIRQLKLADTDKDKMPKDTLGILVLGSQEIRKVARVKNYKIPEKGPSFIAYQMEKRSMKEDSTLVKKEGDDNGTMVIVANPSDSTEVQLPFTKEYSWSERGGKILLHQTGEDSTNVSLISIFNARNNEADTIVSDEGKYSKLSINEDGTLCAFIADRDTNDLDIKPFELMFWNSDSMQVNVIADTSSTFLFENWQVSPHFKPVFTEDDVRIFFGVAPEPLLKDTTLLDEEKPEVEVWSHTDGRLYTQQKLRVKRDREKSYAMYYDIQRDTVIRLAAKPIPDTYIADNLTGRYTVGTNNEDHLQPISWLGYDYKDVFLIDLISGKQRRITKEIDGYPDISPGGKYIYWFAREDSCYYSYDISQLKLNKISDNQFFDERNDRPMTPYPSGMIGWTEGDLFMLVYDHYDIWKVDPRGRQTPTNLTHGRPFQTKFRHINLDRDVDYYPNDTTIMLKVFDEKDKYSGYAMLNIGNGDYRLIEQGPFDYTTRVVKAKDSDDLIFAKSSFERFPDLIHTDMSFGDQRIFTNANPQQSEYAWGSIELVEWTRDNGEVTKGLLVKPENFDPEKKYPMIVNFYEKSSDGLHRHRAPYPHRSTINYSYYTNKGYVIFNPDVHYTNGYPGQSCYDAVVSGTKAMIEKGFIDSTRIGLQGHSWGGYQIAHLVTKTDMFKCAESGAPVVNMISAYGGIRWGSGMSRMFQYEQTQSRLGATLWERPDLYMENSPIFNIDKVNTPVLILHNDKDGAVPWYQGIEFFVAMRRLGKPCWMLNYNDEPHWPLKRPNRLDFNKRMEQFFDHYLMDAPMPSWMKRGVPAVEKGYLDGFGIE